jgi:hypothetical protein
MPWTLQVPAWGLTSITLHYIPVLTGAELRGLLWATLGQCPGLPLPGTPTLLSQTPGLGPDSPTLPNTPAPSGLWKWMAIISRLSPRITHTGHLVCWGRKEGFGADRCGDVWVDPIRGCTELLTSFLGASRATGTNELTNSTDETD